MRFNSLHNALNKSKSIEFPSPDPTGSEVSYLLTDEFINMSAFAMIL